MQEIIEVLDRERLIEALCTMVGASMPTPFPEEKLKKYYLPAHPLGLTVPPCPLGPRDDFCFLAWPGYTQPSVEAMSVVIMSRLVHAPRDDGGSTLGMYLRINRCEAGPGYAKAGMPDGSWTKYDYIFEFGWGPRVFLVGGCNNHSGEGGRGGRQLEAVFDLAASLLGVPQTEAIIPARQWEMFERRLTDELYRQDAER